MGQVWGEAAAMQQQLYGLPMRCAVGQQLQNNSWNGLEKLVQTLVYSLALEQHIALEGEEKLGENIIFPT